MSDGHVNKCKTCNKQDVKSNYRKNISHYKAYDRERLHKPDRVEARKELSARYKKEFPEKLRAYKAKWRKNNLEHVNSLSAKRRASKLLALPSWARLKKIKEFYINCPKGMVVDHTIPLQGKDICGLHVENNLQYLTPLQNSEKSNKFTPYIEFPSNF